MAARWSTGMSPCRGDVQPGTIANLGRDVPLSADYGASVLLAIADCLANRGQVPGETPSDAFDNTHPSGS